MDKYDVYEHTAEAGGYQGTRFYTTSSKQSKESRSTSPIFKLIAEGVSDEEARNLTACTPEICRLLAAVEEAAYDKKTGKIDQKILQYQLFNTMMAIAHDREERKAYSLSIKPGFSVFTPLDNSTERNRVMIALKEEFSSPNGSLGDLTIANLTIALTITNTLFPISK